MDRLAIDIDGCRPFPMEYCHVAIFRYFSWKSMGIFISLTEYQAFKILPCTAISRHSDIGWKSPPIFQSRNGTSTTSNGGVLTTLH